jgi:hypothetical protein
VVAECGNAHLGREFQDRHRVVNKTEEKPEDVHALMTGRVGRGRQQDEAMSRTQSRYHGQRFNRVLDEKNVVPDPAVS